METEGVLELVVKVFIIILLFIYFLVSILITRQVFLMNRAIKTKIAGCLNLLALMHIFLVSIVFVFVIFV